MGRSLRGLAAAAIRSVALGRAKYRFLNKAAIANHLGRANGYRSYLEIATATTGGLYDRVRGDVFPTRHRVLYNRPEGYDDGEPIDFGSTEPTAASCLRRVLDAGHAYDVVFADSWHTREATRIDLDCALRLVSPGGVVIVHDCSPLDPAHTAPTFTPGDWLGVSYLVFLELVGDRADLDYCVIDTDHGVGLIWRRDSPTPRRTLPLPPRPDLSAVDFHDWPTYLRHRRRILRLISPRRFFRTFG